MNSWVYPAHVSCPVIRNIENNRRYPAIGYPGYIAVKQARVPEFYTAINKDEFDRTTEANENRLYFAGVLLDQVDRDDDSPLTTVQLRGVTNVHLHKDAIPRLTSLAKGNAVYGTLLYLNATTSSVDGNSVVFCASDKMDLNPLLDMSQAAEDADLAGYCPMPSIGFVHTYHCNSNVVEMEIIPRATNSFGDAVLATPFVFGAPMVDAKKSKPERVLTRLHDQATLNAASGFATALGSKTNNSNIAVSLGSFVATQDSYKHMPDQSLGVKVVDGQIAFEPGSVSHAMAEGTRAAKRKGGTPKISNLDDVVMVQNGVVGPRNAEAPIAGIFPSRHFTDEDVERFQKRFRSDLASNEASDASLYADDLLAANS